MKKTGMLYNGKKNKSYISYAAVPIIFVLVQMFYHIGLLNSYWYQIIQLACINGIVAMSLNLVNGITGQFSLGQAGFMSVGAYTSAMLTKLVFAAAMENPAASYLLFFAALVIGASAAALIGFLIGIPSLRLRGDYLAIITLGFSEIIRVLWRVFPYSGRRGLFCWNWNRS